MCSKDNKEKALISVIVPALNQEKFIGRCLRSLLAQTLPREDYKIIAVNDGSTDKTSYALNLFREDIVLIDNKENLGLPASLNKAIKSCNTPYIVRVDSDDYVSRHFLQYLYLFLKSNPHMHAVACDYNLTDDMGNVLSRENCLEKPIACGILFKLDDLVDIGLYDETFRCHEDSDLRLRFLRRFSISRLEMPLYRYRRHSANMTGDIESMDKYMVKFRDKHGLV